MLNKTADILFFSCLLACLSICGCQSSVSQVAAAKVPSQPLLKNIAYKSTAKTIHVFVALCDNKYQGIVPVPAKIGNGQDMNLNLYWGNEMGVRTYFKHSKEWKLVKTQKMSKPILQRLVFKNIAKNYYLVADGYDGQYIKQTTIDLLHSCAGQLKDTIHVNNTAIGIDGNAALLAYIGHDGLMDFNLLPADFKNADGEKRDCIILACISQKYFAPAIKQANCNPLVWTTGLMCPEAYTLHDALTGYINGESNKAIKLRAVKAYNKYQKSGIAFADNLLASGW